MYIRTYLDSYREHRTRQLKFCWQPAYPEPTYLSMTTAKRSIIKTFILSKKNM